MACALARRRRFFSRKLHELGVNTVATRRVRVLHHGDLGYPNDAPHGRQDSDESTAGNWRTPAAPPLTGAMTNG